VRRRPVLAWERRLQELHGVRRRQGGGVVAQTMMMGRSILIRGRMLKVYSCICRNVRAVCELQC
jgi:hypothetical protein